MLITALTQSATEPQDQDQEDELLQRLSEDYLFKECSTLLKDYFNVDFLTELKDNKQLMFRLYKLYLLH